MAIYISLLWVNHGLYLNKHVINYVIDNYCGEIVTRLVGIAGMKLSCGTENYVLGDFAKVDETPCSRAKNRGVFFIMNYMQGEYFVLTEP